MGLTSKELTPGTWRDFEALFGPYRGVRGGCWCAFHLVPSSRFQRMTREERYAVHRDLATRRKTHGVVVYEDGAPIAWCQFGRPETLSHWERSPAYRGLGLSKPTRLWRITCIFTDKHRRGEGLAKFALHEAVAAIRRRGGGVVEAFPFEVPGVDRPSYTGTVSMYAAEGFRVVGRMGISRVMRRTVRAIPNRSRRGVPRKGSSPGQIRTAVARSRASHH